jgi:hypothetical protein
MFNLIILIYVAISSSKINVSYLQPEPTGHFMCITAFGSKANKTFTEFHPRTGHEGPEGE